MRNPTSITVGLRYCGRCEDGLDNVMSGVEVALAALEEYDTQLQRTQFAKENLRFEEKNNKLFTRMLLATADCREG